MFVLDEASCEPESLRSQLHHSWLKNEVLILRPEFMARMRETPSPQRASFEEKIKTGGTFWQRIEDARRLYEIMTDGFSPAQLVDSGDLGALSEDVRTLMKKVLHDVYLQETGIEDRREILQVIIIELSSELEELRKTWFQEPPTEFVVIAAGVERVLQRARKLSDILTKLPSGIVLP